MKKILASLLLIFLLSQFSPIIVLSDEIDLETEEEEDVVLELPEFDLPVDEEENEEKFNEQDDLILIDNPPIIEYDYKVKLSNLSHYSIVALNNAHIDSHIRGSLWVGGTLTSGDYHGADDGSINHQPSGYESYIYNNESTMYFQGRTNLQSEEAYKILSYDSVENTRKYWSDLLPINSFGEEWIYVEPDENGHVDLTKWDYQCNGNDEVTEEIQRIYWTNAKTVTMGGLAGHLIAPFADIDIISCNHCGSIVGWNITTHGEAHINNWIPIIVQTTPTPTPTPTSTVEVTPTPTSTPKPGKIILQKTLVNDVWHIRCDVMDGITFHAGGGIWKTDVIMNPNKELSKEGHRSNKCGDADHWIIWLDNTGTPFRMDEIKSGATGGTLPTMIFKEVYSPADLGLERWSQLEPEMTDKVELYKKNFTIEKDITTIKPGERIYWVTWNGDQRWYHSGIPYIAPPTFIFYIDGEPYPIVAGNYLELEDVLPGAHEIREDVSTDDYIITIFGSADVEGAISTVNIIDGETIEIEYVNEHITPPTVKPSTPPTFTPTPSPTPSPTPTPTPTESPIPTLIETPTPSPSPTVTTTPEKTTTPTPKPTITIAPTPTPTLTSTPTINPTIIITTITPTATPTATPTIIPTLTTTPTSTPTSTPIPPTAKPTPTPTIPEEVITLITPEPTPSPTPTPAPTMNPIEMAQLKIRVKKMEPVSSQDRVITKFASLTEQQFEDLIDILDYDVPLYGGLLPTGDEIPWWVYMNVSIFTFLGLISLVLLFKFRHI